MRIATVLAVAFLGATCLADPPHAQAAIKHYQLNIPRQPLDTALKDLAQQTGLQIGRFSERVDGSAVVGPIHGDQTPEEALKILLSRTGLAYKIVSDTTIAIYNPSASTAPSVNKDAGDTPSSKPTEDHESRSFRDRFRLAQGGTPAANAVGGSSSDAATTSPKPASTGVSDDRPTLSEVVVTGTLIASQDAISAHPLSIISSDTLQITNTLTVDDILTKMPEVTHQGYGPTTNFGQQTGITGVDLRNLGTNRTLVLMNGIRYTPTATIGNIGVNLATIPVSLIDHIEVLRDGASPIYGADAVAGVINIITKRNFTGFEGDADASISAQGDRPTGHLSLTFGHDFERGNIVANIDESYKAGLRANQRDFTRFQIQQFAPNGDGTFTGIYGSPYSPGGTVPLAPSYPMFTGPGQTVPLGQQLFVEPESAGIFSRTQITTGTLQGHYDLGHNIESYLEGSYSHEYVYSPGGPPTLRPGRNLKSPTAGIVPADNPYNAFGVPVPLYREYDEIGIRHLATTINTWRLLGGLRGELANGWKWDAHYAYGSSNTDTMYNNNINALHLLNAFDPALCAAAPGCVVANPFGPDNISAAAADYLRLNDEFKNHYLQQMVGISLSGNALTLPAGPLGFAIGAERRREAGGTNYDPVVLAGDSVATFAANTLGSYSLSEGFAEINVPVLSDVPVIKSLTVDPAVRYSDYSTFGGHSTWKVGIDWATGDDLRVRASKGTAFRAPDIHELFGGVLDTFATYLDPCDSVTGQRSNPKIDAACQSEGLGPTFRQFSSKTAGAQQGNPRLSPETADEDNIGVVLTPHWLPGLTATVDYYRIHLRNAVFQPQATVTLQNCYANFGPGNPDCGRFTRGADGQVSQIILQQTNIGAIQTSGVDFSVADAFNVGPGRLSTGLQGEYLSSFRQQTAPNQKFTQYAGTFAFGQYTRLRMNADVGYALGDWSFHYEVRYIKGGTSILDNSTTAPAFYLRTPDVYYNDVSASFRSGPLMVVAGIENLADKQPPDQTRYFFDADPYTYDIIGRNFFLKATLRY